MSADHPDPLDTEHANPVEPPPFSSPWAAPYAEAPYTPSPFLPPPPPLATQEPAATPVAAQAAASTGRVRVALLAACVAALVGAGAGAGVVLLTDGGTTTIVQRSALTGSGQTATPAALDGSVSAAAAKIRPSVVTIQVAGGSEQGTGSGVILTADGYILTNNHVVSVAGTGGTMTVQLGDGTTAAATLVGTDASSDLAVIKIDAANLTPATFASSAKLVVGQSVVAVGAPLGLSDTVTSGIVSNTARPVRSGDNNDAVFNAVQTDAAINPGNSGGPLVDLNGEVVGINAAIATESTGGVQVPGQSSSTGNIGIGFAIPADEATRVADELIKTGKATHAVLGVSAGATASSTTTPSTAGAVLKTVDSGGAGAKAGLKAGDIVTKIGDQRVNDVDGLIAAVRAHAPGEQVDITYVRDGKAATVSVTLGSA
ncbi:MAG: putative serine protease PepD [Pseudonocardiales bacterium]|nr:putative serine protease PepD [Pseudonocardiales bacterium]